ncbi:hypothetical protein V5P93_004923 [Actinokineospora auranticolor]|uniref:Uncharacterized protein n=1 Tax=Actinokineospora auranticolor TaxID=155976 RepID=A0A2S6GNS3_9PSEU|nr:hypothetical protein [Actinokineospora auranticolor]PPK66884.1 hypothetical protein CLV40_109269 [Actinokineospora auranticolor]
MRPYTRALGAVALLFATIPLSTGSYQLVGAQQVELQARASVRPAAPPTPQPVVAVPCHHEVG